MVEVVPLLLTWYSPYASVNQLNEVEKPSREDGERAKEKEREADWGKKKREPCCVKGQYVVFGIITGCWFCVAEGENSTTQSTKVLSKMLEAENQSLFRSYHAVSNLHTHTHTAENHPSPEATNFKHTAMCCWCSVCSAARAGAAADRWKQRLAKANTVQGGGQPVDWWDSVAHTGCGAQVLTCNYEPFIGHNVNCTAKHTSAQYRTA